VKLSACRVHPSAAPFVRTCSGCAQDCHDAQYGNPTNSGGVHSQRLADRVRKALGRYITAVRPEDGETPVRRLVWSIRELDELHARVGGAVAVRQVERTFSDGAYTAMEVTVTVTLPGIAWPVEIVTDWDPADEPHGFALPVIRALNAPAAV
jgi:hypothetical protein